MKFTVKFKNYIVAGRFTWSTMASFESAEKADAFILSQVRSGNGCPSDYIVKREG